MTGRAYYPYFLHRGDFLVEGEREREREREMGGGWSVRPKQLKKYNII